METYVLFFFALSAGLCIWLIIVKCSLKLETHVNDMLQNDYDVLQSKYNHLKCKSDKRKEIIELQDQVVKNLQEEIINLKIK